MTKKKAAAVPMTIDELERLINSEEDTAIEILPNGTVRKLGKKKGKCKPLTMKQNLGGEYASLVTR